MSSADGGAVDDRVEERLLVCDGIKWKSLSMGKIPCVYCVERGNDGMLHRTGHSDFFVKVPRKHCAIWRASLESATGVAIDDTTWNRWAAQGNLSVGFGHIVS